MADRTLVWHSLRGRLRRRDGGVLLLGFLIIAVVMLTLLPSLVAIGKTVDANVTVLTQAQAAAYAASGVVDNDDGVVRIRSAEARQRALAVISANIGHDIATSSDYSATVYIHNPEVESVADSMQQDPDCNLFPSDNEAAPCWRDDVVGAYHRAPGVSVILRQQVDICLTWSFMLRTDGDTGCGQQEVVGYGYAEFTTQSIEDENDIEFSIDGPEPIVDSSEATLTWTISGTYTLSSVTCVLDGNAIPCPHLMSGSAGTSTYSGLAPGKHTFRLQATGQNGISSSETFTWTVKTPPHDFWVDGEMEFRPESSTASITWQGGGSGTVDPSDSSCELRVIQDGTQVSAQDISCMAGPPDADGNWSYEVPRAVMRDNTRYEFTVYLAGAEGQSATETYWWQTTILRRWVINGWQRENMQWTSEQRTAYTQTMRFHIADTAMVYDLDPDLSSCTLIVRDFAGTELSRSDVSSVCFDNPADDPDGAEGWYELTVRAPANQRVTLLVTATTESDYTDTREVPEDPAPAWQASKRYVKGYSRIMRLDRVRGACTGGYTAAGSCRSWNYNSRVEMAVQIVNNQGSLPSGVNTIRGPMRSCSLKILRTNNSTITRTPTCANANQTVSGGYRWTVTIGDDPATIKNIELNGAINLVGGTTLWGGTNFVRDLQCLVLGAAPSGQGQVPFLRTCGTPAPTPVGN